MSTPENQPWQQSKQESARAFEAARLYFLLGSDRSLEAVARKLAKSRTLMSRWSATHSWVERAQSFDDYNAALEQTARLALLEEKAAQWVQRESALRDRRYSLAEKMLGKVESMLDFPLAQVTKKRDSEDGKMVEITTVKPARWSMGMAARLAETGFDLAAHAIANKDALTPEPVEEDWTIADYVSKPKEKVDP